MASEQPELLFFDTFSHETSEKHDEVDDISDGLAIDCKEKGNRPNNGMEVMEMTKKEDTSSCDNSSLGQTNCSSSLEVKKLIIQDEVKGMMGTNDYDLCELEVIKNIDGCIENVFDWKQDLWIPSNKIERLFSMEISRGYGVPDTDLLTFPKICESRLINRLDQVVGVVDKTCLTNCLTSCMQNVSEDEFGLLELVKKEAYSSAVNLTARLLANYGMSFVKENEPFRHSPQSIQLWFSRLLLLVKMQEYQLAEKEACYWGDCDKPDLYYQFYPSLYDGRRGSMVPFQMRLLLANLPSYCDRHTESLERLFSILTTVRKIIKNIESNKVAELTDKAEHLWNARKKRVLISIVNVAVKMKDYILAVEIVNELILNESDVAKRLTLYSILGRIHLQFGDLSNAENFFCMAGSGISGKKVIGNRQQHFQNVVDSGLLAVARNDFDKAYRCFEEASFIDPSSVMVMNNCAVCLFYLGHSREGVRLLMGAVNNDPPRALQDCLVLNLCTLYELTSAHCRRDKVELLKFTTLFKGESINVSSFRLI